MEFPGPRDELDSGSVAELVEDSRVVPVTQTSPTPWEPVHVDIEVPDDASALLAGLGDYGS
ncbi:hypothetical protein N865_14530 [Intrasporangium oryzae NRRL B-24470]|uniref:Uncharacterized protein n=2 Tax=Intrasporangium TaxID=53357 RepID=W9G5L7_9MICO|nr:hypothetical protein N865_14530 [Intrasporangium oryzae NRRL B-24470]